MANQRNQETQGGGANGKDFVPMPLEDTGDAVDGVADKAGAFLDRAKASAGEAYGTVSEKAASAIEDKKAGLSDGLASVAESIRRASDSLTEGTGQNYVTDYSARYAQTAADKIEQVATYFQGSDLRKIATDTEDFARRNPAVFLSAAFITGLLAARLFKSSPVPSTSGT